MGVKLGLSS